MGLFLRYLLRNTYSTEIYPEFNQQRYNIPWGPDLIKTAPFGLYPSITEAEKKLVWISALIKSTRTRVSAFTGYWLHGTVPAAWKAPSGKLSCGPQQSQQNPDADKTGCRRLCSWNVTTFKNNVSCASCATCSWTTFDAYFSCATDSERRRITNICRGNKHPSTHTWRGKATRCKNNKYVNRMEDIVSRHWHMSDSQITSWSQSGYWQ